MHDACHGRPPGAASAPAACAYTPQASHAWPSSPFLDPMTRRPEKTLIATTLSLACGLACAQASRASAPEAAASQVVASVQQVEIDGRHYDNGVGTSDAASQGD